MVLEKEARPRTRRVLDIFLRTSLKREELPEATFCKYFQQEDVMNEVALKMITPGKWFQMWNKEINHT